MLHINPTAGSTITAYILLLTALENVIWNPCCFQFPNLLRLSVMPRASKSKKFREHPMLFYSSAKRDVSYDVNRRAAYAMKELAPGREGMMKFCNIFDMPPCLVAKVGTA